MTIFKYPRTLRNLGDLRRALNDMSHLGDDVRLYASKPCGTVETAFIAFYDDGGTEADVFVVVDTGPYAYVDQPEDFVIPKKED